MQADDPFPTAAESASHSRLSIGRKDTFFTQTQSSQLGNQEADRSHAEVVKGARIDEAQEE